MINNYLTANGQFVHNGLATPHCVGRLGGQNFRRNGYTLTLNQMLFDGFATANDVRRLDKARLTRYFQVLEASEGAALEAAKTYLDVVRYQRLTFLDETTAYTCSNSLK